MSLEANGTKPNQTELKLNRKQKQRMESWYDMGGRSIQYPGILKILLTNRVITIWL